MVVLTINKVRVFSLSHKDGVYSHGHHDGSQVISHLNRKHGVPFIRCVLYCFCQLRTQLLLVHNHHEPL